MVHLVGFEEKSDTNGRHWERVPSGGNREWFWKRFSSLQTFERTKGKNMPTSLVQ